MKRLNIRSFSEKLKIRPVNVSKLKDDHWMYFKPPTTKDELICIIYIMMSYYGDDCDFNTIDVSKIQDFSELFNKHEKLWKFNGDISKWDVSKALTMEGMFMNSNFNQNISEWNVSNVTNMENMFNRSGFDQDISGWNVLKVTNNRNMFYRCPLDRHPEKQPKFNF